MDFTILQKGLIDAMKAKDKLRKETISSMVAATKKLAIDEGTRDNIPNELVERALLKEVKTAKEMIETCPADRTELMEEYKARLAIIEEYAPRMMTADEVETLLKDKYADVIATKNKGNIMKTVMAELKGKADGKVINETVAKLCQ